MKNASAAFLDMQHCVTGVQNSLPYGKSERACKQCYENFVGRLAGIAWEANTEMAERQRKQWLKQRRGTCGSRHFRCRSDDGAGWLFSAARFSSSGGIQRSRECETLRRCGGCSAPAPVPRVRLSGLHHRLSPLLSPPQAGWSLLGQSLASLFVTRGLGYMRLISL